MRANTRLLKREQLDRQLKPLRKQGLALPPRGWIRTIRDALGMNGRQLADRMGVAYSYRDQLEKREVAGTVTIKTLERAAEALGCDVVYALIPKNKGTFEAMVHQQAQTVARRIVDEVDVTMALEAQPVDSNFRKREIERIASELAASMPRALWN